MITSPKYSINKEDLKSLGRGACYALAGALLTYITSVIPSVDFGPNWTPVIVAFWSVASNLAYKYLKDGTPKVEVAKPAEPQA